MNEDKDKLVEQDLIYIADNVAYWISWTTKQHEAENMPATPDTHVWLNGYEGAPPHWPSIGQLTLWVERLRTAATALEAANKRIAVLEEALERIEDRTHKGIERLDLMQKDLDGAYPEIRKALGVNASFAHTMNGGVLHVRAQFIYAGREARAALQGDPTNVAG